MRLIQLGPHTSPLRAGTNLARGEKRGVSQQSYHEAQVPAIPDRSKIRCEETS
jgi:hypothetical protein